MSAQREWGVRGFCLPGGCLPREGVCPGVSPVKLAMRFPEYVAQITTKHKAVNPVAMRKELLFKLVPSVSKMNSRDQKILNLRNNKNRKNYIR